MRSVSWRKLAIGLTLLTTGTFYTGNRVRAADEPQGTAQFTIRFADADEKAEPAGRFWIGVMCEQAGETLHAQLPDLPKDQGVVVEQLVPDGPAAKAGIQVHDILFTVGDKPIHQVSDLSSAIEASKGTELGIKLLRAGKTIAVAVKPQEKKSHEQAAGQVDAAKAEAAKAAADAAAAQKKAEESNPQAGTGQPFNVRFVRAAPGPMPPPGSAAKTELPEDLTVDIRREGKKPARIIVRKGDQKWEVGENELDKLPEEVRRHVEPLLAGGPMRIEFQGLKLSIAAAPAFSDVKIGDPAEVENRLAKQVDELSKQLDEMRAAIIGLRAQHYRHDAPAGPPSDKPHER